MSNSYCSVKEINVKESYTYETNPSDVKLPKLKYTTGKITAIIKYDSMKDFQLLDEVNGTAKAASRSIKNYFGSLNIKDYGNSALNSQLERYWDRDELPIRIAPEDYFRVGQSLSQQNRFDLELTQNYRPEQPLIPPLEVTIQILDEDFFRRHSNDHTLEKELVDQLSKQISLKRNLITRFVIRLTLPEVLGQIYQENPPFLSSMSLTWPIGTPYQVASVFADQFLRNSETIIHNPEQNQIEWSGIQFKFKAVEDFDKGPCLYYFETPRIQLEISEPAEIYENDQLVGLVTVELNNLLSGMIFEYKSENLIDGQNIDIKPCSILTNKFKLNLSEGLKRKSFSPRQHLHFPGIVFNHMRLADIVMLLEDKGFELPQKWLSEVEIDSTYQNGSKLKKYRIKAERLEGARQIIITIDIQSTDSSTNREREILGKEKYTTSLPIGYTDFIIQGEMEGDPRYIIWEVNDLQKQLKEQFSYVSTVG